MNTGQRLGLVFLYVVMAGNAVLMLRLFIQILFRKAIERHRRRQFAERNGGATYTLRGFDGKRGWTNRWLPRNPEIVQPAQNASTVAAQQRTGREVTASTVKQQLLDVERASGQV